jgi:DNA-binding CsgD family transcriptional regulator
LWRKISIMLNLSDYDRVVSQIYEAALVPAHWDIALTSLINLFGPREWEVAMVLWERLDPPMGRFIGAAGVHDLARSSYLDYFAGQQEWSRRGHEMPIGRVAHSDELIPRDEFRETPFYQHFLQPWGFEVALIGNLDRHDKDHMGIVCPGPPDLDPGDLHEAIVRLTPHFQRAARISRRIGEADLRAVAATDVLDNSPYCVMALGPNLELLLANSKAQRLLDRGDGFQIVDSRVKADDPATARKLEAMAAGRSEDRSFTFSATGRVGQKFLLQALAVSSAQSDQFAARAGGTALMIVGGQRIDISEDAIDALQHGFDLTAAEARLAAFLLEGTGVRGYADARGVSLEAGKYLLKSIYAKTGLSNQTELIALLREAPVGWGKPLPAIK